MLVDPVGREPGPDPVVPPRQLRHLGAPGLRRVPVVADVVVVEDHRRRDGRHQPADLGVTPGVPVEPLVLGEADHLIRRAVAVPAVSPPLHPMLFVGWKLVGVELVAEQDQRVGPLLDRTAGHPGRIRVQRIVAEFLLDLLHFGFRIAARPEDGAHPVPARGPAGADDAGWELRERLVVDGPFRRAVHADLVLRHAVGRKAGHQDEGEVVALHLEGLCRAAENLDSARIFGLHPDQGGGV